MGIAMNVKTNDYYGTLYAGNAMNVKTNVYYGILYASIAYLKMVLWKL